MQKIKNVTPATMATILGRFIMNGYEYISFLDDEDGFNAAIEAAAGNLNAMFKCEDYQGGNTVTLVTAHTSILYVHFKELD